MEHKIVSQFFSQDDGESALVYITLCVWAGNSPIPNFFRKKNLKKLMTSAKISNFRILPIFADVIIFFKKIFLKKLGIGEMYLWSKFGKDKLHTFRDIAILRFMTS